MGKIAALIGAILMALVGWFIGEHFGMPYVGLGVGAFLGIVIPDLLSTPTVAKGLTGMFLGLTLGFLAMAMGLIGSFLGGWEGPVIAAVGGFVLGQILF